MQFCMQYSSIEHIRIQYSIQYSCSIQYSIRYIIQYSIQHSIQYSIQYSIQCSIQYSSNSTEYSIQYMHTEQYTVVIRKRALTKAGWGLQQNKKFRRRYYPDVNVERDHSQIRNPASTTFPVSYVVLGVRYCIVSDKKKKDWSTTVYLTLSQPYNVLRTYVLNIPQH